MVDDTDEGHVMERPNAIIFADVMIQELMKHTPEGHADLPKLKEATEQVKQMAHYIENKKAEAENMEKVIEIQSSLIGKIKVFIAIHRSACHVDPLSIVPLIYFVTLFCCYFVTCH